MRGLTPGMRGGRGIARLVVVTSLTTTLAVAAGACGLVDRDAPPEQAPREEPGQTLSEAPPPADWQDVHSASGLVYSVPPEWEIGDPFGAPSNLPGGGAPGGGALGGDPAAEPSDWSSGYVTTANAVADRDYCAMAGGHSFRVLTGISDVQQGEAREQAESASRTLADAIDRRFTRNGADVPVPEPVKIGVSGVPAWHVSLRGQVRPPRDSCTPPAIRFDAVAVATRTADGAPASHVFLVMADEGEPGTQPEEAVDAVVASLRFDNSV